MQGVNKECVSVSVHVCLGTGGGMCQEVELDTEIDESVFFAQAAED